jgi:transposase InsO family protein
LSSVPPTRVPAEKLVRDIRRATRKHHSAEDKIRIVLEGLRGEESIAALCRREAIAESLYFAWSKEFLEAGKRRLAGDTARAATSDEVKALRQEARALKEVVAEQTLELRLLKSRDLISSPAFIQIKAAEEFHTKTTAPNQLWQTDFTYLKVIGWGWFYLCTVLDDFSRYVIAWRLCTGMTASDVSETLELAITASGCRDVPLRQRPRLLSDNGPGFISDAFAQWLAQHGIQHVRGAPAHPQTQGKIERWHQTMKNRILLENYYLPGALQAEIEAFVEQYNHRRYHESLNNLTPADVYFGRGQTILLERERIKRRTIQQRRLMHHQNAA